MIQKVAYTIRPDMFQDESGAGDLAVKVPLRDIRNILHAWFSRRNGQMDVSLMSDLFYRWSSSIPAAEQMKKD